MLIKCGLIKNFPIKSAVIIANPKSILNKTKCPKVIQTQLYKYDQLTNLLKKELDKLKEEMPYREKQMFEIAEFLMTNHKPITFDYMAKYSLTKSDFEVDNQLPTPAPQITLKPPVVEQKLPPKETLTIKQVISEIIPGIEDTDIYKALKEYRLNTSRAENIKPYFIYNNDEMESIIRTNPKTKAELLSCKGFGEKKFEKYGDAILEILRNNQ
jgi:superfamily II DNA helicase RecQ